MIRNSVEDRFWDKVRKSEDPNGCWEWFAYKDRKGYGRFRDGRVVRAHRWAYEHLVGPIPANRQCDHLCRNRACVNPAHIELVTNKENTLRGVSLAAQCARRTVCKNGHPLVVAGTRRRCPLCRAEYQRVYRAANLEKLDVYRRAYHPVWEAANREKRNMQQRARRAAKKLVWEAANREKRNMQQRARRAAKKLS